ncbi:hypothetical protein, conserved [Eimeria acervulina]|uniref:Uncharacterized protein n=1 Tax=Eimeria acervulina TaxID=5801 RepID=U6GC44_EIMAC|nr:hypothetical protein, conserved [Eimeria acervulina]CDI76149.1 hypothetical protein, conserved [Eimeria acervulina]
MDRNGGGFFRIAPPGISRNRGSQGPAPYQCTSPSQTTVCPLSLQVGMELAFLASRVHKEKAGSSRKALQPAQPAQHTCPAVAEPFMPHGEELAFNPPIRVQDCNPFQQPLRPLEIRGTKVHLDPQEPAGSEGPSSCAFELSMRGRLSDLVLEGRLQGAAYAILEVDSSWVWLLSAYGLYSPKASRVVEQLLRKFGERLSTYQQDGETPPHNGLPSSANCSSSPRSSSSAGAQEAEPLAGQMRTSEDLSGSIIENSLGSF